MTIVEFLNPIISNPLKDLCVAALYYAQRYEHMDQATVDELRALLKRARVPNATKLNLADALARAAPHVDVKGKKGKSFLWTITSTGQKYVRTLLGLPEADVEIEHDVSTLDLLLTSIPDKDMANYVQESITCLSIGALRAAVVFLWAGAVRKIQETVMTFDINDVNKAVLKYDSKARTIMRVDDLAYIKESTLLFAAQELGIFDKNQRGTLGEALDLRNKCGHPGKYKAGPKKASAFIEDVIGIVFT